METGVVATLLSTLWRVSFIASDEYDKPPRRRRAMIGSHVRDNQLYFNSAILLARSEPVCCQKVGLNQQAIS